MESLGSKLHQLHFLYKNKYLPNKKLHQNYTKPTPDLHRATPLNYTSSQLDRRGGPASGQAGGSAPRTPRGLGLGSPAPPPVGGARSYLR